MRIHKFNTFESIITPEPTSNNTIINNYYVFKLFFIFLIFFNFFYYLWLLL